MKKLFVLIAMTALLFSCEKEPVTSSMNYLEVDTTIQDSINLTQDTVIIRDTIIYDTSIFILNMGMDTIIMVEPRGTNFDTVNYHPDFNNMERKMNYRWKMIVVDKWEKIDDNDTIAHGVCQFPIDNPNLLCYFNIYVEYIVDYNNDGWRDKVIPINYYIIDSSNAKTVITDKYEYSNKVSYYSEDPNLHYFIK